MKYQIHSKPVLVIGASGYVGARLVPRLLERGYHVCAAGRSIKKLKDQPWTGHSRVELMEIDVFDRKSVEQACKGCFAAYYLVHSMSPYQKDFAHADREAATNMAWAAEKAGLKRIIYLGGLGEDNSNLSEHLRSRIEVGKILQSGNIPTTILRAAMIIGAGSASFEILRYLVERLPIMITPRWVSTECQPIAIRNAIDYLVGCLELSETIGQTFDIGGPEVLTYRRLMDIYTEEANLQKRLVIPVPVLTPRLSSYWIHLVTPLPASLARPLAEGLSSKVVCIDDRIRYLIPQNLLDCRQAIRLALDQSQHNLMEDPKKDKAWIPPSEWSYPGDPKWAGGTVYEDHRRIILEATPEDVWQPLLRIGGQTGWYYADWLWSLRGFLDRLIGGVGMRRGRSNVRSLDPGDIVDFWRVAMVEPQQRLLLVAEMKLPGRAILDFRITEINGWTTELHQIARFIPRGLGGVLYWNAVTPFHQFVFTGMLRRIGERIGKPIIAGPEHIKHQIGSEGNYA
jgi:uncharacterized protein YbjT (DUF2867 family)